MEKKQSSIEWFYNKIKNKKIGNRQILLDIDTLIEEFEQAKSMHKEEVQDAWLNGMKGEMIAPFGMNRYKPEAEEYYNETFGGTTGVIVFDNIHLTNTSGTNHLSHINPLTDKLTNMEVTMSEQNSVVTLIQENESVIKVNKECERGCGNRVTKYDKFTEEEYCENCGWS